MRRSEICDGKRIAQIRTEQGLSQSDLANMADCCERLVRKAESSEAITYTAIHNIASALSQNGHVVQLADLVCSPTKLTKQFLQAFATFETEMVAQVKHFIDENFTLYCAGDPQKIPFAGEWQGLAGLDQWICCFFQTLTRPQKDFYKPEFLTCESTVVTWGIDWAHVADLPYPPAWTTKKFDFSKGKLIHFEYLFDTDSSSHHVAQARAKGLLSNYMPRPSLKS